MEGARGRKRLAREPAARSAAWGGRRLRPEDSRGQNPQNFLTFLEFFCTHSLKEIEKKIFAGFGASPPVGGRAAESRGGLVPRHTVARHCSFQVSLTSGFAFWICGLNLIK